MAGQIINTHTFKKDQMVLAYQVPTWAGITDLKIVVNNYEGIVKDDEIIIRTVGDPGRQIVGWVLQRIATWTPVTQDEQDQRKLFVWTIKDEERYIEENLFLGSGDQIRTRSKHGYCNMVSYGDLDIAAIYIEQLRQKVMDWTITETEKQNLALLTAWGYNYNENNCTNNCSCP